MSGENGEQKEERHQFNFFADNPADPEMLTIQIPVGSVARDKQINGFIFMIGFLENCRNEAVVMVKRKRDAMSRKSVVVTKGSFNPNGIKFNVQ